MGSSSGHCEKFPKVRWHFLDEDDWEEEDESPAALGVVVLEDAGDPPLAVNCAGRHAAVLRLLHQPTTIDHQNTFWHIRRLHLQIKSCVKTSFSPSALCHWHIQVTYSTPQPAPASGEERQIACLFKSLFKCKLSLWGVVFVHLTLRISVYNAIVEGRVTGAVPEYFKV